MHSQNINLPSKPKIIKEEEYKGIYEIDGLYPGYGYTLGTTAFTSSGLVYQTTASNFTV
jgi:hypothetical protein